MDRADRVHSVPAIRSLSRLHGGLGPVAALPGQLDGQTRGHGLHWGGLLVLPSALLARDVLGEGSGVGGGGGVLGAEGTCRGVRGGHGATGGREAVGGLGGKGVGVLRTLRAVVAILPVMLVPDGPGALVRGLGRGGTLRGDLAHPLVGAPGVLGG